jgi:hypothetical protein
MSVDLSVLDLLWLDHRLVCAPTSTTYEVWVAAGKPCLRRNCGHRHGSHIPSEGMECNECNCLGFVGFAHPTIRGAHLLSEARDPRNRAVANVLLPNKGFRPLTDPNPTGSPQSMKCPDHDRHSC